MKKIFLMLGMIAFVGSVASAQLTGNCGTLTTTVTQMTLPSTTVMTPAGPFTIPSQIMEVTDLNLSGITANPGVTASFFFLDIAQLSAPDPHTGLSLNAWGAFIVPGITDPMTGLVNANLWSPYDPLGTPLTVHCQALTIDFTNYMAPTWCVSNLSTFTITF